MGAAPWNTRTLSLTERKSGVLRRCWFRSQTHTDSHRLHRQLTAGSASLTQTHNRCMRSAILHSSMQVQCQELAERLRLVSGQTSWYLWRHKATNQNHYIFTVAPPTTQSKGSMCNTSVTVSTSLFNYASKMLQLKINCALQSTVTVLCSNCRAQ